MTRFAGLKVASRRALLCVALLVAGVLQAAPAKLFKAGNVALAEKRYEDAINAYHEALAEAPGSAEIAYNLGNAQYRATMFEDAMYSYEHAASLAETDAMRGQCWYNIGNCLMKTGESVRETDGRAAAAYCQQAAWLYRMALGYDPAFENAAYNLEISLRIAAQIEEEVRQQEEQQSQQDELIAYLREKLQEFIERQTALIETQNTGEPQRQLETETRELAKVIEDSGLQAEIPLPDGTRLPGPLKETFDHTLLAAEAMAKPDQPTALAELVAALGAAPEDPNQQDGESDEESEDDEDYDMDYEESDEDADQYEEADPFGDFSEYEEIRGVPPPNATEMDILAEEVRNQERRKEKKAGEYKAVEKDW
ncbi:tetratricopeptide repeat protein [Pontiella sp.]|uniref:tetratricopeptide repeat protein n=1 Tax=Pontiella sp. TaxID=2837462 RepID=UPI003564ECAA